MHVSDERVRKGADKLTKFLSAKQQGRLDGFFSVQPKTSPKKDKPKPKGKGKDKEVDQDESEDEAEAQNPRGIVVFTVAFQPVLNSLKLPLKRLRHSTKSVLHRRTELSTQCSL